MSSANDSDGAAYDVLLLTAQQAAALCQVSVDKIYEWSYTKGFPVVAGAHQIRIHARLFEQWLEQRAAEGRPREQTEDDAA